MQDSDIPYKFATPWGTNAAAGYLTNPIPAVSAGPAAGQDLGFPPITAANEGSGGIPPDINDFNGALYYATAWLRWVQAGGPVFYDATLSTNVGGYPKGALLRQAAAPLTFWLSQVDNNTSDPDTGGANWIDPFALTFPSSGVVQDLPSGFILQIFAVSAPGTTSTTNTSAWNYPEAFPNTCFFVLACYDGNNPPVGVGLAANTLSRTQVNITINGGTTSQIYGVTVIAFGK